MNNYEIVVIGAGPAAIASMSVIPKGANAAVITGAVPAIVEQSSLHPKIRAVSSTRNESAGVAEILRDFSGAVPLFSTAAAGGLTNYWGQQFKAANVNDPWPRHLFENHFDFLWECRQIEKLFEINGGLRLRGAITHSEGFSASTPRLLLSNSSYPRSTSGEMKGVFYETANRKKFDIYEDRTQNIQKEGKFWNVHLENGTKLRCEKIVLAGGVIGDARILLRSFPDLQKATFRDHTPWMLYTLGFKAAVPIGSKGNAHFNQITLEQNIQGRAAVFASIYNMKYADLNLLFASTIGFTSRILGSIRAPAAAALLKPIQAWTEATSDLIEVKRTGETIEYAAPIPQVLPNSDNGLTAIRKLIESNRGRILTVSRTRPGYGFHYYALRLSPAGSSATLVSDFLKERTDGSVICVDASVLEEIGCLPPTLTAMACARRLTKLNILPQRQSTAARLTTSD
jgi:hypothetical protein